MICLTYVLCSSIAVTANIHPQQVALLILFLLTVINSSRYEDADKCTYS